MFIYAMDYILFSHEEPPDLVKACKAVFKENKNILYTVNFSGSNTDSLFTTSISNSFLSLLEKIP